MPDHSNIYMNETEQYELLISREDYQHNIMREIHKIVPNVNKLDVLDMGAGTGRLSCLLAPQVQSIITTDASPAMLARAERNLTYIGAENWQIYLADNRSLPIA